MLSALVVVSTATVFLFGLLPAFFASKTDVTRVLKDSGAAGTSRRAAQRWSTVFLAAEFGLAVVLLAQIAANIRSDEPGLPSDEVLDSTQVLTAVLTLPQELLPLVGATGGVSPSSAGTTRRQPGALCRVARQRLAAPRRA